MFEEGSELGSNLSRFWMKGAIYFEFTFLFNKLNSEQFFQLFRRLHVNLLDIVPFTKIKRCLRFGKGVDLFFERIELFEYVDFWSDMFNLLLKIV